MDDLLAEFLTETAERLDELDINLVRFERAPNDAEMLNPFFSKRRVVAEALRGCRLDKFTPQIPLPKKN